MSDFVGNYAVIVIASGVAIWLVCSGLAQLKWPPARGD